MRGVESQASKNCAKMNFTAPGPLHLHLPAVAHFQNLLLLTAPIFFRSHLFTWHRRQDDVASCYLPLLTSIYLPLPRVCSSPSFDYPETYPVADLLEADTTTDLSCLLHFVDEEGASRRL